MRKLYLCMSVVAALLLVVTLRPAAGQSDPSSASNPLSFKIGAFDFTPNGFIDFTMMYRSTDVGSGIGTNFGGIPYSNTVAGRLGEFRESADNSRLGLKISGDYQGASVYGYLETDFLGAQPTNVAVSSNSNTMRMRVYFVDWSKGAWEMSAGQDWSMITSTYVGLDPMTSNILYTKDMDTNYQVGLAWSRDPQFRLMYHASPNFSAGLSLEQGEQYIGGSSGAPTVAIPSAYSAEVDSGASNFSSPGFTPDVVAKFAFDSDPKGHDNIHFEFGGVNSNFHIYNPSGVNAGTTTRKAGGALFANANAEVTPGLRLVANSYFGDGGGRYIFGQAPDFIIRNDGSISLVRMTSGLAGLEYTLNPQYMIYGYYGGLYIHKDFDLSGATPLGWGYPTGGTTYNKAIQEGTVGVIYNFWKSAQYGALSLITQGSYLARNPYTVPSGSPKDAHVGMGFVDLRFTLP